MQSALIATATAADGSSLLALAYHNHVLLYNTTTDTRIRLMPPPSNTHSTTSSSTAATSANNDNDEDGDDDEAAEDDDSKDEQPPHKQAKSTVQPSEATVKANRPLSTQDILYAQNTLTAIRVLLFSPDARQLATADDDKRLTLYDITTGAVSATHELPKRIATACFIPHADSADTTRYELMVADKGGDIHRVILTTAGTAVVGRSDSVTLSHLAIITSLAYSPPVAGLPALLFSSDSDGHTRLSRHPTHYEIHSFLLSAAGVISTTVLPATQLCVSGGVGSEVTVWRYGEAGSGEAVQRVVIEAAEEAVQYIGQVVYDARTSTLFVLSYPSSTVHTFSLPHTTSPATSPPATLTPLPVSIILRSGQPSALSVDTTGRVYVLTDAAQLCMYVRAADGTWRMDDNMRQLSEQVKVELTDIVVREKSEAEEKAGSAAAVAPVWSIGMTVYARWQEKLRREKQMNEKQAQLAEQRANRKRKQ